MKHRVGLIVPTLNAGGRWQDWLDRANRQSIGHARKLAIDGIAHLQHVGVPPRHARADAAHGCARRLGVAGEAYHASVARIKKGAGRYHHHVYVVELSRDVLHEPRFKRCNQIGRAHV